MTSIIFACTQYSNVLFYTLLLISTFTLMNTINKQTAESTGAVLNVLAAINSYTYTLESWFTNLEQTPLIHCQQLLAPYNRLIDDINKTYMYTYKQQTNQLILLIIDQWKFDKQKMYQKPIMFYSLLFTANKITA